MEKDLEFSSAVCTSREQSERLLALGLKKETADMKYLGTREYYGGILTEGTSSLPIIIDTEDDDITEYDTPAWSLHRLIEMMPNVIDTQGWLSIGHQGLHYSRGYGVADDGLYESIVRMYEWLIKEGHFNKEYLV